MDNSETYRDELKDIVRQSLAIEKEIKQLRLEVQWLGELISMGADTSSPGYNEV